MGQTVWSAQEYSKKGGEMVIEPLPLSYFLQKFLPHIQFFDQGFASYDLDVEDIVTGGQVS